MWSWRESEVGRLQEGEQRIRDRGGRRVLKDRGARGHGFIVLTFPLWPCYRLVYTLYLFIQMQVIGAMLAYANPCR